jgi:hypothetical protein
VDAGLESFEFPASHVVSDMMVSAEGLEFDDRGVVGFGPGDLVVDVA